MYGNRCITCNNSVAAGGTVLAIAGFALIAAVIGWLFWGSGATHVQLAMGRTKAPTAVQKPLMRVVGIILKNVRIPLVMMQVLTQFAGISNVLLPSQYKRFLVSAASL